LYFSQENELVHHVNPRVKWKQYNSIPCACVLV